VLPGGRVKLNSNRIPDGTAVTFYKSKAWTDLAPERDKAVKATRRYVVETEK